MADIPVNWTAAPVPQDYTAAALEGAQAGQAERGISALQGIDLNDPDSLNKGIGNLVRAGAADQASALMGLQIKRGLYGGLSDFLQQATGGAPGSPMAAPGGMTPPQPPAPAQPGPVPAQSASALASNPQLAAMHAEIAKDALDYGQTDPKMQPILGAVLKAKYAARGIDPAAIDQALSQAATPDGAAQFAGLHTAHAQLQTQGNAQGLEPGALTPPAMQPPPQGDAETSYTWAKNYLAHPQWSAYEAMLKSQTGVDLGLTARAQAIMGPEFGKEAELRNAPALGAIAAQTAGRTTAATQAAEIAALPQRKAIEADLTPPVAGASPTFDVNGNHIGWHMPDGSLQALASTAAAKAGGEAGVRAQYDVKEGPTGSPGQTTQYRLLPNPNGGPPIPTPLNGAALPRGFGTTAGTAAEHGAAGQADALNVNATAAGNRLPGYAKAIADAQALQGIANTVGTGAYTGALKNIAQYIPGATAQTYAANAGLLAQRLAGSFKDQLGGLPVPRITSEAKSITDAIPKNTAPQDQVKLYAAMNLAATQYHQSYDQFLTNWAQSAASDPSKANLAAANAAWAAGPGAQSLFAMPALQGVTLGGEPAVIPHQVQANGHTYNYLIPLHGLVGKNAIPIRVN